MDNSSNTNVLDTEKQHVSDIVDALSEFRNELISSGLEKSETIARLDEIVDPMSQYNDLLQEQTEIDPAAVRTTQNKLSEFLMRMKLQLFSDVSSFEGAKKIADESTSTELANSNASEDVFDSLVGMVKPGNAAVWEQEALFSKLDDIIYKQSDYTATLSANALTSSFTGLIEGQKKTAETVGNLIQSTGEFAASIMPALQHLQNQAENSQNLLENNQEKIEQAQAGIGQIEEKQTETAAKLMRTQIGVNKTRREMGMGDEFDTSLRVAGDAQGDSLQGAANDDLADDEPQP
ncbi:MAG: hypothetical protein ACRBCK_02565 [Alphaproteobacteria bacterium]